MHALIYVFCSFKDKHLINLAKLKLIFLSVQMRARRSQ